MELAPAIQVLAHHHSLEAVVVVVVAAPATPCSLLHSGGTVHWEEVALRMEVVESAVDFHMVGADGILHPVGVAHPFPAFLSLEQA